VTPTTTEHATRDSVSDLFGPRAPYAGEWPVRIDEITVEAPERWIQSACVLCSVGCALDIGVREGRIVGVRGRPNDVANHGRLGPKGMHGWQANASRDRLLLPRIRRDGRLQDGTWDEAMRILVAKTLEVLRRFGPKAIGFYNSGQLLLEEYYTLAIIGDAGIGTPHMDGSTRLCTATAAAALSESFGSDGQPGCFADIDVTDALFHVGHNPAATQTVLWTRILDRLSGPRKPRLVVADPRRTETARAAEVHLRPKPGTNVALMNGLLRLLIERDWVDRAFVREKTIGWEALEKTTSSWTLERTRAVTGISHVELEKAAEILGTSPTLVSTVLQGVYQSNQATAAAVQVNNLHLIRGLIGKPGATVFQMNGQPSAQNTRECGANGELIAFRNFSNEQHVKDQARVWNVRPEKIPQAPPTHAMQIVKHAEEGSIRLLWVLCSNPAVSMPSLARIRNGLEKPFLVVSDAFENETTEHADLVLPTALWGEKTGTFTSADRTVHIAHRAIDPPGEARSDLDILLDFARRMGFQDKDGTRLVKWRDAEGAFEAWKESSRGRPCDYTGLTYAKLSGSSGIHWPCDAEHPDGAERLYTDGVFNTATEFCETFGHDLATGEPVTREQHEAMAPKGRAILKAADYEPPPEQPDDRYPLWLTTGRVVHHWHTRTKTGRVEALNEAEPEPFLEISAGDAELYGIDDCGRVEVESRRSRVRVRARITDILPGTVFMPFHYGTWDTGEEARAANELTLFDWDPVSKQPYFKCAAVRVKRVTD
jgi:anaerobic selenocysteine-containing dehydrogenase